MSEQITLEQLNQLESKEATAWFQQTCTANRWCKKMVEARPFASESELKNTAKDIWQTMEKKDWFQAFQGHPMIGDIDSLRAKFANTRSMASNEQSGTKRASTETLEALRQFNYDYLEKHGFIFIICATGLSADTMLEALKQRLNNETTVELINAAEQQIQITLLRLTKGLIPAKEIS